MIIRKYKDYGGDIVEIKYPGGIFQTTYRGISLIVKGLDDSITIELIHPWLHHDPIRWSGFVHNDGCNHIDELWGTDPISSLWDIEEWRYEEWELEEEKDV